MANPKRQGVTKEAAAHAHAKPQTLLKHYHLKGHYYGIVPVKLPSRILLWDLDAIDALVQGGTHHD